jgi:hypothetical protein
VLKTVFQPLINLDIAYTQSEASALDPNPAAFWAGWGGSLMILVFGLAGTLTLALALVSGLCPAESLVAMLIANIVISGAVAAAKTYTSTFSGSNPFSSSIVTDIRDILVPASGSQLDTDLSDLSTVLGSITTTWAVQSVETAATPPAKFWDTSTWGSALGIMALLTASAADALDSVGGAVVSLLFDGLSLWVDWVDLSSPTAAVDHTQDVVTVILDGVAGVIDGTVAAASMPW